MSYVLAESVGKFKNYISKKDEVKIDNVLFRAHHQVNFVILLVGLAFTFVENYIDGDVIECYGEGVTAYTKKFCFLHGTGHIKDHLQSSLTGRKCRTGDGSDDRLTAYYMWLPLVLTVCMGLCKVPRYVWKNVFENGFMRKLTNGGEDAEKIAESFYSIKKRNKFMIYNVSYAFCELLNIAIVFINFKILDHLLNGMFWSYGKDASWFLSLPENEQKDNIDPMCNVFPTEVNCNERTGAIGGGKDVGSHLCILSNNVINQKYFLVLWWWWVFLITLSMLGLVYRLGQISMPAISCWLLKMRLDQAALSQIDPTYWKLINLSTSDLFILSRMASSLDKEVITKVLTELRRLQKKTLSARADTIASENAKVESLSRSVTDPTLYPALDRGEELSNKVTFHVKDESVVGLENKGLMD
eukprot:GFUD01016195.1.p1 GENE.GFUD01016195.1~~GFUD01016195.1.p1  ORF type:complete len:414 (+),score=107.14 GFUD01016195.1:236-1477(+)